MTVEEVIRKLETFNPKANVFVLVHNRHETFTFSYGGGEGGTREDCEDVSFYVDRLNQGESTI